MSYGQMQPAGGKHRSLPSTPRSLRGSRSITLPWWPYQHPRVVSAGQEGDERSQLPQQYRKAVGSTQTGTLGYGAVGEGHPPLPGAEGEAKWPPAVQGSGFSRGRPSPTGCYCGDGCAFLPPSPGPGTAGRKATRWGPVRDVPPRVENSPLGLTGSGL